MSLEKDQTILPRERVIMAETSKIPERRRWWPLTPERRLVSLFAIWIFSLSFSTTMGEVTYGSLRPDQQAEWAKDLGKFLNESWLAFIALPLMYVCAVIVWVAPVLMFIVLKELRSSDAAKSAETPR